MVDTMILGQNYIKKELKWFGLLVLGVVILEYLLLFAFQPEPMIQLTVQLLIAVIVMTATLRTGYRIWLILEYEFFDDEEESRKISK